MHKHAILIIKKDNKYLQYYDERWKSYLFFNCKLNDNYEEEVTNYLKTIFNTSFNIKFIKNIKHKKYSVSNDKEKEYDHYFYYVKLQDLNDDNNFKWFTMEELECDKRIMEVNSDIIGFVKEMI